MSSRRSPVVKAVSFVALGLAVAAIFVVRPRRRVRPGAEPVVRQIKTLVLRESFKAPHLFLPGRVKANDQVSLAFEVSGQIVRKDIIKGQKVKKGDVLAELDPRDYQNKCKEARAALDRSRAHYDRIARALEAKAVSQEDMSNAKAEFERAAANMDIARKALSDTVLRATFDGNIADVFVDTYATVKAGMPVVSLQNVSKVQIEVSVPERYIVNAPRSIRQIPGRLGSKARFDSIPGREFPVSFKEFTPIASSLTQTYAATFVMPAPADVLILPGMSVNVEIEAAFDRAGLDTTRPTVPSDLVAVDPQGRHYVWAIEPVADSGDAGLYEARRLPVAVGRRNDAAVEIVSGLRFGQRIAAAGVSLLAEGQRVRLLNPPAPEPGPGQE